MLICHNNIFYKFYSEIFILFIRGFVQKIQLNTPIVKIKRHEDGCEVFGDAGFLGKFDRVIMATHSDDALAMLDAPRPIEEEVLSGFSYQNNHVILHQDTGLMPPNPRAWASWNYRCMPEQDQPAVLTYNMNRLQHIDAQEPFLVSLNAKHLIDPQKIIAEFNYSHPQYTLSSLVQQKRQAALHQDTSIFFCGAYWGAGFHEDGVRSALSVCECYDIHPA